MNWHYSRTMPVGKLVTVGLWEDTEFRGAVLFGRGANPNLGAPYGLEQTECVELVRVALREHSTPVSQVVAKALKVLRATSPGVQLVVSFADTAHGHHGGIYQAGNWVYTGKLTSPPSVLYNGKWTHSRALRQSGFGTVVGAAKLSKKEQAALPHRPGSQKLRYLYPMDRATRKRLQPLALPYLKRDSI